MPYKDEVKRKAYHKAYSDKWQKENKDKVKEYKTRYKASKSKEWHIINERQKTLKKYNLTLEQYEEKLKSQNYQCAICGKKAEDNKKAGLIVNLYVDHCHSTNKTRSLLCHNCNFGLGYFKDNPEFLLKAIDYLYKHMI